MYLLQTRSGIDVGQGINVGPGKFGETNKRMALNTHVLNNHLNNLYVLSNKAVGPGKNPKLKKRRAYFYSGGQIIQIFFFKFDAFLLKKQPKSTYFPNEILDYRTLCRSSIQSRASYIVLHRSAVCIGLFPHATTKLTTSITRPNKWREEQAQQSRVQLHSRSLNFRFSKVVSKFGTIFHLL